MVVALSSPSFRQPCSICQTRRPFWLHGALIGCCSVESLVSTTMFNLSNLHHPTVYFWHDGSLPSTRIRAWTPCRSESSMKTWTQRRSVRSAAACAAGHAVAPRGVAARRFRLVECAAVPTAQRWRAPPPPQHLPISRVCTCGLSMPCNARICALGKFALFNHMNKSVPYVLGNRRAAKVFEKSMEAAGK